MLYPAVNVNWATEVAVAPVGALSYAVFWLRLAIAFVVCCPCVPRAPRVLDLATVSAFLGAVAIAFICVLWEGFLSCPRGSLIVSI